MHDLSKYLNIEVEVSTVVIFPLTFGRLHNKLDSFTAIHVLCDILKENLLQK